VKLIAPLIPKLDVRWMRIVSFALRSFYSALNQELFIARLFHFIMSANKSYVARWDKQRLANEKQAHDKTNYCPIVASEAKC
jgi:hypothetical protein